ncbi:SGNH/GDSL hydrolase family protein [Mycolicibacterium chlorophenolicum]|uniref:GDSL-like Lipase/Acylhydrolase n=1 Tax=Mycolicibacterium chlorophenolicum TaxID=37916 RepID=A0A0J6ZF38_9MYCO|nr:SGNH/GDSL hydrolase family protein [Mycolicibacterium chlorophenolicum]KMO83426.1 GDSL-like Lipase/Acylhydrolase [Mycolicibacterium chlorophenolicum]
MISRFRGRVPMPRRSTVLLAVLSIAAVVAVPHVILDSSAAGPQESPFQNTAAPPTLPSRVAPAVLFIGDSYTLGPTTPDLSYGCLTATALGWECNIAAEGGTGYLSGGPGHRLKVTQPALPSTSFVERLPRLREMYRADVVVLDGGRNDMQFATPDVDPIFAYTVKQVVESWPNSRIVVIGPWFLNEPVIRPPSLAGGTIGDEFRSVLRSNREFDAVDFIDPGALGWFVGIDTSPYVGDDGIHPTFAGVKKIAELLTKALKAQGVTQLS